MSNAASVPQEWSSASLRRRSFAEPNARSLLFTILGEFVLPCSGPVWSSALVGSLNALGVQEKAARQALARTASDGWLSRERAGRRVRWRLTDACERLLRDGAQRIYSFGDATSSWDGRWVIVLVRAPSDQRDVRHQLRTRLSWAGFSSPAPGVWLSPHAHREDEARRVLTDLGLDGEALSFVASSGTVGDIQRVVRQTWDLEALEGAYGEFVSIFAGRLPTGGRAAFVSHTNLLHEWRKFPFIDPGLPAELLPDGWIGVTARDLFHRRHAQGRERATGWFRSLS